MVVFWKHTSQRKRVHNYFSRNLKDFCKNYLGTEPTSEQVEDKKTGRTRKILPDRHTFVNFILDYFDKHDLKEMSSSDYKRMIQNLPVSTWSIFSNEELLWQRLLRNAGCGPSIISLEYLRESLASSEGNRPPIEFQNRYFGRSGPVLSTVHAAKGSEARHVLIDESGLAKDNFTSLEEAKVVFVALSYWQVWVLVKGRV